MSTTQKRLLLAVYAVAVLGLTLAPTPGVSTPFDNLDKVVHGGLFGGLALLVYWNFTTRRGLGLAVVASLAAAALIELAQKLLAYRSDDFLDLLAGGGGVAVGIIVAVAVLGRPSKDDRA